MSKVRVYYFLINKITADKEQNDDKFSKKQSSVSQELSVNQETCQREFRDESVSLVYIVSCEHKMISIFLSLTCLILIVAVGSSSSLGITLNCNFKYVQSYWGLNYACLIEDLRTSCADSSRTVNEVKGIHKEGKTNDDVTKVIAEHQFIPCLPLNLGAHFKNLEILYIMRSNVTLLTHKDLTGLTKLKLFDVSYNPIKRLKSDFFKGHGTIEIISFYDCQLSKIDSDALNPLVNLKEGHFERNECIDYRGDDESLLPDMLVEIEENCGSHTQAHYSDVSEEETSANPSKTTEKIQIEKFYLPANESFTRRHANPIIAFLLIVILALCAFLYKVNAFNRLNWR